MHHKSPDVHRLEFVFCVPIKIPAAGPANLVPLPLAVNDAESDLVFSRKRDPGFRLWEARR